MSTTRALSAVTALLLALATLLVPVSAHAAEDTVRSLEVALDVAADGTLSVRYDVEWYFGGEFRTAPFIIITREPWDEGGSPKDLVREVSNLQVTTPQGDPVEYEQTGYEAGSHGQVKLRIGDPDSAGRTLRYAVSYDVRGALRTTDGVPELVHQVTDWSYPLVEKFEFTVTGPDGVESARCHVGPDECQQEVVDGVATMHGILAADGEQLIAVARFPAGSVADAEPVLTEPRADIPEVIAQNSELVVAADGTTHVEHTLTYAMPQLVSADELRFAIPTRARHDDDTDRLLAVSDITLTRADGTPLTLEVTEPEGFDREQHTTVTADILPTEPVTTVVLAYDVAGAVGTTWEGDETATFRWPLAVTDIGTAEDATTTVSFPGTVLVVDCTCTLRESPRIDGGTVVLDTLPYREAATTSLLEVHVPADSVGGVELDLANPNGRDFAVQLVIGLAVCIVVGAGLVLGIGLPGGAHVRRSTGGAKVAALVAGGIVFTLLVPAAAVLLYLFVLTEPAALWLPITCGVALGSFMGYITAVIRSV